MKQKTLIRKFIASFLLAVFIISTAPKAYFHDAFADHRDTALSCTDNLKAAHLHQSGINCHFDQWVVSSFYYYTVEPFPECPLSFVNTVNQGTEPNYLFSFFIAKECRGPPSV